MRFAIFVRKDEASMKLSAMMKEQLLQSGFFFDDEHPELVICVGGDGTFLRSVHRYHSLENQVRFLCVRSGSLCYFGNYEKEEIQKMIDDITFERIHFQAYPLLKANICYLSTQKEEVYALNEIRIENPFKTMICTVSVDGEFLEEFRGNGVLISSTLGSTAYNKSCGGALLDSELSLLEYTKIAPIENISYHSIRESIVFSGTRKIHLEGPFVHHEVMGYDHLLLKNDSPIASIDILYGEKKVLLAKIDFVSAIKKAFIQRES